MMLLKALTQRHGIVYKPLICSYCRPMPRGRGVSPLTLPFPCLAVSPHGQGQAWKLGQTAEVLGPCTVTPYKAGA